MGSSVGLLGGTFDPVHNGHIAIANAFLRSPYIDELWVLLTPYPPHKQEKNKSPYAVRLQMLKAAFTGLDGVQISTVEDELPQPSYTYQTVRHLKKNHPDTTFYFCMGEDSLAQFHNWKNTDKIIQECELLVAKRPGISHQNVDKEILKHVHFVEHIPSDISSSTIRKLIRENRNAGEFLPEKVLAIIKKNQLYSS